MFRFGCMMILVCCASGYLVPISVAQRDGLPSRIDLPSGSIRSPDSGVLSEGSRQQSALIPDPSPTANSSPSPDHTPPATQPPVSSATPVPSGTPPPPLTPSPTPSPSATSCCQPEGVRMEIPLTYVYPGQQFWCRAYVCHDHRPFPVLFAALLDIGVDEYWFYPEWVHYPPDYTVVLFNGGPCADVEVSIVEPFTWPDTGDDRLDGITLYAAMLNSSVTEIVGELGIASFSYGPVPASPTPVPTIEPTVKPTGEPTVKPTGEPTTPPSLTPSPPPQATATFTPSPALTPTVPSTPVPTEPPTSAPTPSPTPQPTSTPTPPPTVPPTPQPTSPGTPEPSPSPLAERVARSSSV